MVTAVARMSRLVVVFLAGAVVLGAAPAGASIVDAGPIQVGTSATDQPQDYIAVSNNGTATSTCWSDAPLGWSTCPGLLALSTTGSASAGLVGATLLSNECASGFTVSVAVTGPACGGAVAISGLGTANGNTVGVSGAGSASSGVLAMSGTGPASATFVAVSVFGPAYAQAIAVSGTNTATATGPGLLTPPVELESRAPVQQLSPGEIGDAYVFALILLNEGFITADQFGEVLVNTITSNLRELP